MILAAQLSDGRLRHKVSERPSERIFLAASALLFAASAALTIVWCGSMSSMGEMPMPGGWNDVDGVDADARTDVARRRGVVPRHVGRDDGGDDAAIAGANAVALPPGRRQYRRDAPRTG